MARVPQDSMYKKVVQECERFRKAKDAAEVPVLLELTEADEPLREVIARNGSDADYQNNSQSDKSMYHHSDL